MLTFIAGATMTGAVVARSMVERKSSARPWAILARIWAVAGAMTTASAAWASEICSIWPSSSRPVAGWPSSLHMVVMTLWPVSEEKVSGWMNSCGGAGHGDADVDFILLQCADEFCGLVGGDSAGDADQNARCFSVHETPSPPRHQTCIV